MDIIREDFTDGTGYRYGYYAKSYFVYHRDDGSAYKDNYEECWYQCNKLHRLDGPARMVSSTNANESTLNYWHYNGKLISVSSQEEFEKWLKYNNF